MTETQPSTARLIGEEESVAKSPPEVGVNLREWGNFFVLPTHLSTDEVSRTEEQLEALDANVTYDISEACLIVTAINSPRRARFELQTRKLRFEVAESNNDVSLGKRKRSSEQLDSIPEGPEQATVLASEDGGADSFRILKLDWLYESHKQGAALNTGPFTIMNGKWIKHAWEKPSMKLAVRATLTASTQPLPSTTPRTATNVHSSPIQTTSTFSQPRHATFRRSAGSNVHRQLLHETTTEHDKAMECTLPDPPDWVKEHGIYACQRSTPLKSPNRPFIDLLKKIVLTRILNLDEIGVRAYSTSIASIAAYPHPLSDPREILLLPGCEKKITALFREYQTTGDVSEAHVVERDPALKVINDFYQIYEIGAKTARDFYHKRGWRDVDDIVQFGWHELSRGQQIGVKYLDEFEQKMHRSEVEFIASVVTYHAKQLVDEDITCTVVGGYRRGKNESSDADLVLSHPREEATLYLIRRLIKALERALWITHTLKFSETNSARDQQPVGLKVDPTQKHGGFDTLDKALVVWQDPGWPNKEANLRENPGAKNPNPHRRVDIIISPWRTVGCAVTGWTSGTTFQRDLRRYVKATRGWKFDSSGVRDRATGRWIDLEKWTDEGTRAKTPLEAEKRVFEGLGLDWIEPEERNTG